MNAIQTITKTLNTSNGAKVNHVQLVSETEIVSINATEIMGLVSNVTKSVLSGDNALNTLTTSIEQFNHNAIALHNGGVRLQDGRSKDKATQVIRSQFLDELKSLKANTSQKYYEWFMRVVNTGKPLKSFNDDSKKKSKKPLINKSNYLVKYKNLPNKAGLRRKLRNFWAWPFLLVRKNQKRKPKLK